MKRILTLTLCLCMLAAVALAGTMPLAFEPLSEKFNLVYALPEGVSDVSIEEMHGGKLFTFILEDETMPNYILVVSYSEVLHEKNLSELTDEEIAAIVAYTAADSESHAYAVIEMDDGWPGVLIDYTEEDSESDWVDAFTVINGFIVQVHGWHDDFAPLTDAENAFAFTLLDSVNIVEVE